MSSLASPVIFFAKVVASDLPKVSRVVYDKMVMDTRLTMFFKEKIDAYAFPKQDCAEGDYVIIREIPEVTIEDKKIEFNIEKLVYKGGYFVDPVSGKRTAGTEYLDDIKKTTDLFGYKRPYQENASE